MSAFPTTPVPIAPLVWTPTLPVKRFGPFGGRIVSSAATIFPLYNMTLNYFGSSYTDIMPILNFWNGLGGGNGVFTFQDPISRDWENLYVGSGTGAQTVFDLPILKDGGDTAVIKVDGVDRTASITYSAAGGTDGRDKITFNSNTPAAGAVVTVGVTGKRMAWMRWATDEFASISEDALGNTTISVNLVEVRSA